MFARDLACSVDARAIGLAPALFQNLPPTLVILASTSSPRRARGRPPRSASRIADNDRDRRAGLAGTRSSCTPPTVRPARSRRQRRGDRVVFQRGKQAMRPTVPYILLFLTSDLTHPMHPSPMGTTCSADCVTAQSPHQRTRSASERRLSAFATPSSDFRQVHLRPIAAPCQTESAHGQARRARPFSGQRQLRLQ